MSYLVAARRWRPQTFEDLVGQEHVARTLQNAIRSGRVAHAFLFTGVRGVGKTTAARILAKALNCEQGPTPTPCNVCTNCQEITGGSAVDVLEIDGASNTGVDDVRQIIENVRYRAAKSRFKIYIIDEVHMLSNSAFNALLKTLEEPPGHVKFIFATTDAHKLPATVQSRCQRYDFRRIPLKLVVDRLRLIAAAENLEVSDRALFWLAREGEGSMRDAQSILEQVLAGAEGQVQDADVLNVLGIADRKIVAEVGEALAERDARRALRLLEGVYEQGHDMRRLTRDLVEYFRDLTVARVTGGELLPDLPPEEREALQRQAERVDAALAERAFRILRETDEEVGRAPYPRMVLEMALVKIATSGPMLPLEGLVARLEELEVRLRGGGASARPVPRSHPEPIRETAGASGEAAAPQLRPERAAKPAPPGERPTTTGSVRDGEAAGSLDWQAFVADVGREKATLAHHLGCCEARREGNDIVVVAPRGFYFNYLSRNDHRQEVEAFARAAFGRDIVVRVMATNDPDEPVKDKENQPSQAQRAEAAMGDPLVQAALEIFGGEVREVRQRRGRRQGSE